MITDAPHLSPKAREILGDSNNTLFLSAASCWEIAIKSGLGKIRFSGPPERIVPEQMHRLSIQPMPILASHALHTARLDLLHRDPFDRLLVSQSRLERIAVLTPDALIRAYDVETIW